MAVRALSRLLLVLALGLACSAPPAAACFGPKLYWGVGAGPEQEALFALATLYVQEKTGVESLRVELTADQNPLAEIAAERLDLAFVAADVAAARVLLELPGLARLASGPRPVDDLQFTTVAPALRKLATLLTAADVRQLTARVADGAAPLAAARRLLTERRWI